MSSRAGSSAASNPASAARFAYAPAAEDHHWQRMAEIDADAFNSTVDTAPHYFDLIGRDHGRIIRDTSDESIVGGLMIIPGGQYFAGRSIPMWGIAAVAVAPEARGSGAAGTLMRGMLAEAYEAEVPISCLYPATLTLYQRYGYAEAGAISTAKIDPRQIASTVTDRSASIRRATEADIPTIERLYEEFAAHYNGHLERQALHWSRVREVDKTKTDPYLIEEDGVATGYVYLWSEKLGRWETDLIIMDAAFTTPTAGRRIWTLARDHQNTRERVRWRTGATAPLTRVLPENDYTLERTWYWMLRIVRLETALTQRPYLRGMNCELTFALEDEILTQNRGVWRLSIADGRGEVTRLADQDAPAHVLKLDIRGLAALFACFQSAEQLVPTGMATGSAEDLAKASAIFAGATPWMPDTF